MTSFFKASALIIVFATLVIFSKSIQKVIIDNYEQCVSVLSHNTIGETNLAGF